MRYLFTRIQVPSFIFVKSTCHCTNKCFALSEYYGVSPMVKKFFSHYAPRPLQQPQMPDMKQIKRSACNHILNFFLLSYLPSAGHPSTQPSIRRLALPLIRSITVIPPTTPHNPNSLFSAANIHRLMNTPHTSAYSERPYVAMMFRNMQRLGVI